MPLNYNGRVDMTRKHYYGPDMAGNFYTVVDSEYDEKSDKTRVEFELHEWE